MASYMISGLYALEPLFGLFCTFLCFFRLGLAAFDHHYPLSGGLYRLQFYYPLFLDLRLPDLVWHPSRCTLGLGYLNSLSGEYMDILGSFLSEFDIGMASIGSLKCRLSGCFSCKYSNLVTVLIPEGIVFHLFFSHLLLLSYSSVISISADCIK